MTEEQRRALAHIYLAAQAKADRASDFDGLGPDRYDAALALLGMTPQEAEALEYGEEMDA